jgi:hypothetical protein
VATTLTAGEAADMRRELSELLRRVRALERRLGMVLELDAEPDTLPGVQAPGESFLDAVGEALDALGVGKDDYGRG